ncbi:3340_t:CDS:2, partial [Funneliformis mosseae]
TAKGKEEKIKGVRYDNIISRRNNSERWPRTDIIIDTLKTTQARYMLQPTK